MSKHYMCPFCSEYISLQFHRDLIHCPVCHQNILSKTKNKIDFGELMETELGKSLVNEKIQFRIEVDPTFLERYKHLIPILEGNGINIPNGV